MTRVIHLILSLEMGGMERMVCDLASNLDRTKFRVTVVCLESMGPLAEELIANGIEVLKVPPMVRGLSFVFPWELIRILRTYRPQVVHIHSGCWPKGVIAARLAGCPTIVYTEHGRHHPDPRISIILDHLASLACHRVIAVSRELVQYLRNVVHVAPGKVDHIINGIDLRKFSGGENCPKSETIAIVARLAPVKDLPTLLQAVHILKKSRPGLRLLVIGDGPERYDLECLAKVLGIAGSVEFLGFRRDIAELLTGVDLVVLSSLSEGTSMTLLEAMASGKPVVATAVGGNRTLIEDGENGFLVPPRNPEQMAAAIDRILADPHLRQRMESNNRKKVERFFSLDAMTRAYENLYQGTA